MYLPTTASNGVSLVISATSHSWKLTLFSPASDARALAFAMEVAAFRRFRAILILAPVLFTRDNTATAEPHGNAQRAFHCGTG